MIVPGRCWFAGGSCVNMMGRRIEDYISARTNLCSPQPRQSSINFLPLIYFSMDNISTILDIWSKMGPLQPPSGVARPLNPAHRAAIALSRQLCSIATSLSMSTLQVPPHSFRRGLCFSPYKKTLVYCNWCTGPCTLTSQMACHYHGISMALPFIASSTNGCGFNLVSAKWQCHSNVMVTAMPFIV